MKTSALIAVSAIFAAVALNACAKDDAPVVSVCMLAASPSQYHQRQIKLDADVVAEPHGYHLVDQACPDDSVSLVIPEYSSHDAKFTDMMRDIMTHHARGHAVLSGTFLAERIHHQVGTLTADDVLSVAVDN
jgi:hypothetical protein